jgi:NADH:ubiquinone oxidoreductase subunit F (NADH-binding)
LATLLDAVSTHTPLTIEGVARTTGMPPAAVRGVISSYTELHSARPTVRVCQGTSCTLHGAKELHHAITRERPCKGVYCLGYCDRSPVALDEHDRVVVNAASERVANHGREATHPAPPSIRCEARAAVVTERLLASSGEPSRCPDYEALALARRLEPSELIERTVKSGLKGRGGAAFPTGRKWTMAAAAPTPDVRYVIANGDEGDPGSFVDRELMERDPHAILEGMAVCGRAIGAERGVVFIRHEYPVALRVMQEAVRAATKAGWLGDGALGDGHGFHVDVVQGQGSYVCGEETALIAAIEAQRGEVRPRPPFPVQSGLHGRPTVVDNVETLVNVPWLLLHGEKALAAMGTTDSRGTKAMCLNRGFARPGIVEIEFGMTLRELIERHAGGGAGGVELEAVLLGGPMGSIVTPDQWDVPICFAGMAAKGINLGHGGLVAIPRPADWSLILRHLLAFMNDESCGKCTPCRLGSARLHALASSGVRTADLAEVNRILSLMKEASLCAFGRETPGPVRTILEKFASQVVNKEPA